MASRSGQRRRSNAGKVAPRQEPFKLLSIDTATQLINEYTLKDTGVSEDDLINDFSTGQYNATSGDMDRIGLSTTRYDYGNLGNYSIIADYRDDGYGPMIDLGGYNYTEDVRFDIEAIFWYEGTGDSIGDEITFAHSTDGFTWTTFTTSDLSGEDTISTYRPTTPVRTRFIRLNGAESDGFPDQFWILGRHVQDGPLPDTTTPVATERSPTPSIDEFIGVCTFFDNREKHAMFKEARHYCSGLWFTENGASTWDDTTPNFTIFGANNFDNLMDEFSTDYGQRVLWCNLRINGTDYDYVVDSLTDRDALSPAVNETSFVFDEQRGYVWGGASWTELIMGTDDYWPPQHTNDTVSTQAMQISRGSQGRYKTDPTMFAWARKLAETFTIRYGSQSHSEGAGGFDLDPAETWSSGAGTMYMYEPHNEADAEWQGRKRHHLPEEMAAMLSEIADGHGDNDRGIKFFDSAMRLRVPGIARGENTDYSKRMIWWWRQNRPNGDIPVDEWAKHTYFSTAEGQQGWVQGVDSGVCPEVAKVKESYDEWADDIFPLLNGESVDFTVGEFGYDKNTGSVIGTQDATPLRSDPDWPALNWNSFTQAAWTIRAYFEMLITNKYRVAHQFMLRDVGEGAGVFATCGAVAAKGMFYEHPLYDYMSTCIKELEGFRDGSIISSPGGGGAGFRHYRFTHSDGREANYVVEGSQDGTTTAARSVPVNATHTIAYVIYLDHLYPNGRRYVTTITANNVTIDTDETPQFIVTDTGSLSAPSAPVLLQPEQRLIDKTTVDLEWTYDDDYNESFRVERSTVGGGAGFSEIGSTTTGIRFYQDTGRAADTTYFYRVRGRNSAGDSAYSNEVEIRTAYDAPTENSVKVNFYNSASHDTINYPPPGSGYFNYDSNTSIDQLVGLGINVELVGTWTTTGWFGYDGNLRFDSEDDNAMRFGFKPTGGPSTLRLKGLNNSYYYTVKIWNNRAFVPWANILSASYSGQTDQAGGNFPKEVVLHGMSPSSGVIDITLDGVDGTYHTADPHIPIIEIIEHQP